MSPSRDAIGRRAARPALHLLGVLAALLALTLPATPAAARAAEPAPAAVSGADRRAVALAGRQITSGHPARAPGGHVISGHPAQAPGGHVISGHPARAPGGQVTEPLGTGGDSEPHDVALRWLYLSLLAGLIGGLAFAGLVLPAEAVRARRAVLTLAAGAGVLAIVAGLAMLQARAQGAAGVLTGTPGGRLWLVREAVVGALALLAGALRGEQPPRWRRACWAGAAVLAAMAATTEALAGHASGATPPRTLTVAILAAHALAAFVWLGGLASLAVARLAVRQVPDERAALRTAVRGRFAPAAAATLVLVAATGLAAAGREVGRVTELADTAYGRVLLVKGALLLAVAVLATRHVQSLARRLQWPAAGNPQSPAAPSPHSLAASSPQSPAASSPQSPAAHNPRSLAASSPQSPAADRPRSLAALAAVGAVLLLAAGFLTGTPPPRPAAPAATASIRRSATVADLVVSLSMSPGRPGANAVAVLAASGRRPPPAPIDRVTLDLGDGSGPVALAELEPGRYAAATDLPPAGTVVRATVTVHRGGTPLPASLTWTVPAPPPAPKASYRDGLAPAGDALALALLVLALAAWRARRRPATPDPGRPAPKILEDVR